jgi:hypothetical protein
MSILVIFIASIDAQSSSRHYVPESGENQFFERINKNIYPDDVRGDKDKDL